VSCIVVLVFYSTCLTSCVTSSCIHAPCIRKSNSCTCYFGRVAHRHKLITLDCEWGGARGSVVDWGTTLQAGRSPFRVLDEVDFLNLPNLSCRPMSVGSTQPQPLTELSIMNFLGGKKRPGRRPDNVTAIYVPSVWKCGSFNLSQT
jgi:hypothetical protein